MGFLKKFGFTGALLAAAFLFSLVAFFYTPLRQDLRAAFALPERRILSVATGHVLPDKDARVAKVQTRDGMFLEVYGLSENGFEPMLDRIKLPDRRDAYMQFQGRATNLALQDMDGTKLFEIIAPSYDESFVPHLNIYRYNPAIGRFEPYENSKE